MFAFFPNCAHANWKVRARAPTVQLQNIVCAYEAHRIRCRIFPYSFGPDTRVPPSEAWCIRGTCGCDAMADNPVALRWASLRIASTPSMWYGIVRCENTRYLLWILCIVQCFIVALGIYLRSTTITIQIPASKHVPFVLMYIMSVCVCVCVRAYKRIKSKNKLENATWKAECDHLILWGLQMRQYA